MNPHTLPDMQLIYKELCDLFVNYNQLKLRNRTSYNSLQAELRDLQSKYNALTNELNIKKNIMYALLATTIVFIATTAYLAIRKAKVKTTACMFSIKT